MCGVAGFFSLANKNSLSKEELLNMTAKLRHRGPDAKGCFFEDSIGLGHQRLSIVDLSPSSNQPFYSSCGRYVMVYNGEVYNASELAPKLDIQLKTKSDTEVIIELFAKYGPTFVNMLNGMFIIVIYDIQKKELHIFRDRLGIKPLFYFWDKENFIFGSEIKSLLASKYVNDRIKINKSVIPTFLHLGFIPEPHSIFTLIFKFPSGAYLKINEKNFHLEKFWKIEDKIETNVISDFSAAKSTLKNLLQSSVNYRLMADVPVGVFLSGGVDSSLITALAQENRSTPIKTFTVGFEDQFHNEAKHAKHVAKILGTDHHEFIINENDVTNSWEDLLDDFDEPFGDSSCFPTHILSKLAKKEVSVALSGEVSDELFMGYGAYNWAKRLDNQLLHSLRKTIYYSLKIGNSRMKRAANLFDYESINNIKSHIYSQEQYFFSENELSELLNPEAQFSIALKQEFGRLARTLSASEQQSLFDLKHGVKDDLLMKMDISSMLCSLEVRVPYSDYRIIEFALNLSENLKVHNGESKYILKEILYEYIPKQIFERPKKGFSIPLQQWLKGDLGYLIDEYLSKESLEKTGIFNIQYVENIKNRFFKYGENYLFSRIYIMIILNRWILKNGREFLN